MNFKENKYISYIYIYLLLYHNIFIYIKKKMSNNPKAKKSNSKPKYKSYL